jgi:phospholipase C
MFARSIPLRLALGLALLLGPRPALAAPATHVPPELRAIRHLVVLYLENRSFDNLYGEFAGADGIANARTTVAQVDSSGAPYPVLPRLPKQDYPKDLPNSPFAIEQYVGVNVKTPNLTHRFYQEQEQIDGGRMDRFAVLNKDSKGFVMGYYHTASSTRCVIASSMPRSAARSSITSG